MNDLETKIIEYEPPANLAKVLEQSHIIFMVGVSGAGKDTIASRLFAIPSYHRIVSHTTRAPRANHGTMEINGLDYHFIDHKTAGNMLSDKAFIEAKKYGDNVYGTSVAELLEAKKKRKIALGDIEVQGVAEYKRLLGDCVTPIFILPPNFRVWMERLANRYGSAGIDQADLLKRLKTAEHELKDALAKDYFEYVVNDDLEMAVKIVDEIAHGHKSSTKNDQSKKVAVELLKDLQDYLAKI